MINLLTEQCDCGDDSAHLVLPCLAINSDTDDNAACRANCSLKSCGNGIVERNEECEPALPLSVPCTSLGFYDNTVTHCTDLCRYDRSVCRRRCGDSVLDADFESCDKTAFGPGIDDCTDLGYYGGTLSCSFTCSIIGCTGRCGDGVWNHAQEACDGSDRPTCGELGYYADGLGLAGWQRRLRRAARNVRALW